MKHIALALTLTLFMIGTASAREFSKFSIDIPQGWNAMEENGVVAVTAPGNEAAISIAAERMGWETPPGEYYEMETDMSEFEGPLEEIGRIR